MDTHSDDDRSFNPALRTGYEETDQATPVVVKKVNTEVDDGKSEKKVPPLMKKSSTESAEAPKPPAKLETLNIDKPLVDLELSGSLQDEAITQTDSHLITMLKKKDFRDNSHLRSSRYFLP